MNCDHAWFLVADFAVTASSKDWTDFFDLLVGSLVSLLRRIAAVHAVILRAIEDVTASESTSSDVTVVTVTENSTVLLPEQQLKNLQVRTCCKCFLQNKSVHFYFHNIFKMSFSKYSKINQDSYLDQFSATQQNGLSETLSFLFFLEIWRFLLKMPVLCLVFQIKNFA